MPVLKYPVNDAQTAKGCTKNGILECLGLFVTSVLFEKGWKQTRVPAEMNDIILAIANCKILPLRVEVWKFRTRVSIQIFENISIAQYTIQYENKITQKCSPTLKRLMQQVLTLSRVTLIHLSSNFSQAWGFSLNQRLFLVGDWFGLSLSLLWNALLWAQHAQRGQNNKWHSSSA